MLAYAPVRGAEGQALLYRPRKQMQCIVLGPTSCALSNAGSTRLVISDIHVHLSYRYHGALHAAAQDHMYDCLAFHNLHQTDMTALLQSSHGCTPCLGKRLAISCCAPAQAGGRG